ncbi:NAD+ synthase [Natrinema salsiterrestre]|uniref:NH(3)-dependent NAD(+) synthetase n=1 Tax=Natrinema salsiterrestre TaxID=2950540 RepID=A0A9Q4PZV6_9EURY|nr:NAD+ synthase [Natrinema salsiterrestre]MDF9744914.1 NAD+ synthase [Natrinema salsiterrestre]
MSAYSETFVYSDVERTNGPFHTDYRSLETIRERIVADIRTRVANAGAAGVVVAMSGGIDSTLTTALAVEALGTDRVLGLGLPCHKAEGAHVSDARTIAEGMGIDFEEIQLRPLLEAFEGTVASELEPEGASSEGADERALETGNVVARLRMVTAYYAANRGSRLVLGTANRSEQLLGYFTKYGDGAADAYPIGECYKTEVRALAKHVGIPRRIIGKEPTAGFWATQTDADELGAQYDVIDPLLYRLVDEGLPLEEAVTDLRIDRETAEEIALRHEETAHKRSTPPTPGIAWRTDERSGEESGSLE